MKRSLVLAGILTAICVFQGRSEDSLEEGKGGRHNITQGAIFTDDFRQQEGVQGLKNGILYKVEATGKGKTPKTSDRIKVNYVGKHVDGRIFDQSKEGQPGEFKVDRTVAGWQDVLPRMREGDRWEVVIPSHLAYGASGTPYGNIGPNETLVFTIELVEVMDPVKKPEVK
jgi:FKBP-type peptidyl-prolyl cis-trans isomerase